MKKYFQLLLDIFLKLIFINFAKQHLAREPNPQFLVNLHSDAVKGCDTSM